MKVQGRRATCYNDGCEFIDRFTEVVYTSGKSMKVKKEIITIRGIKVSDRFLIPDSDDSKKATPEPLGSFVRHHCKSE